MAGTTRFEGSVPENGGVALSNGGVRSLLGIAIDPSFFTGRHLGVGENRLNGALRNAGAAIDALIGVDDEVRVELTEGFNGADGDAFLVLVVHTR
jgi:hypothetical protein